MLVSASIPVWQVRAKFSEVSQYWLELNRRKRKSYIKSMTIEEQRAGIHQVYQQRFNEVEDSAYVDLRKAYNVAIDKSKTSLGDIKQFWQYNVCNGAGYGQPCAYRAPVS